VSDKPDASDKTMISKALRVRKLMTMAGMELDELVRALEDPEMLHAELSGRRGEIDSKLDRVLDMMIEVKKQTRL